MFVEMCEELKISRDISNVRQLVPFDWFNIKEYIGSAYADYFGKGNFTFSMALLITYEQYIDTVFDGEQIEGQIYLIKRCAQVDDIVIKAIRDRSYKYCHKLFGDIIKQEFIPIEPQASCTPMNNGDFMLPWKYVEFMNGKIFLYHPTEYGKHSTHPLVVANKKSKIAMNYIKRYLSAKSPALSVRSKNGVIVKLNNNDDLLKCVGILDERLKIPVAVRKPRPRSPFHKRMGTKEIVHKLREYKSRYLDFLCGHQTASNNIVYCPENRVNEEAQAEEDSFVFTIRHTYGKMRIVFENTLNKRSSIVVDCYERQYDAVVKTLSEYFASEIINKRENIRQLKAKLERRDASVTKVIHTSYEQWKENIIR